MRISLLNIVLLAVWAQKAGVDASTPAPKAPIAKAKLAPMNVVDDIHFHHPCKIRQEPETLEMMWTETTKRIRDNKKYPGQLVSDMVDLACIQRNLYSYSDTGGARADLKIRFSNSVNGFILEVVDNFKIGLQELQSKMSAAENARITRFMTAVPADRLLNLERLLQQGGGRKYNEMERERVQSTIRSFVDVRTLLVQRFVAAYPLVLYVAKTIQDTNDFFKGVGGAQYKKGASPATTSKAPKASSTTVKPPSKVTKPAGGKRL